MQSDRPTRYASETAADAERYVRINRIQQNTRCSLLIREKAQTLQVIKHFYLRPA